MSEAAVMPESAAPEAPPTGEVAVEAAAPEVAPAPAAPPSWRDTFQEDVRDHPALSSFENPEALAKSHIEQGRLIGKKGLIQPDEKSTPDEVNAYYTALGRPETVDGYGIGEFQPPEILSEVWGVNGVDKIANIAFEKGVTKDQWDAMVGGLAEQQAGTIGEFIQTTEQRRETAESSLKELYGVAYGPKLDFAKRGMEAAAESIGITREALAGQTLGDGTLVGDNADLTQIFANWGEMMHEVNAEMGGEANTGATRYGMTPAEAVSELEEININPALHDRSAPGHQALVDRRTALNQMAYPDTAEEGT